jgi:hypothetical protein
VKLHLYPLYSDTAAQEIDGYFKKRRGRERKEE